MSLLGEGSFGCVFTPSFPCEGEEKNIRKTRGENTRELNLVSKVFTDKKEFNKEIRMSKKAAAIDPKNRSIVVPVRSCRVSRGVVDKHPAVRQCDMLQSQYSISANYPLYQLLMPYGGTRIDHFLRDVGTAKKPYPLISFLSMVEPLFEGLLLFEAHKMCHQDIKTANILVTPHGKAMYIDYGLMNSYDKLYTLENQRRLKYTYFPYPPEYKIAYYLLSKCNECVIDIGIKNNIAKFGDAREAAFYKFFSEHDVVKYSKALQQYLIAKHHTKNQMAWLTRYANRVDVYSLGTALVDASRHIYVPVTQEKMWYDFVRHLIHPDVRKRYTPKQAHQAYLKLRGMLSS
jgi:serine/threonine protein kinase